MSHSEFSRYIPDAPEELVVTVVDDELLAEPAAAAAPPAGVAFVTISFNASTTINSDAITLVMNPLE